MTEHKGYCGGHHCTGAHDRCLIIDKEYDPNFKPKKRGDCPLACMPGPCERETQRLECIYLGDDPSSGKEGTEIPVGDFNEPEKYEVFSFAAPLPAAFILPSTLKLDASRTEE